MELFVEKSFVAFLFITVILGGGIAFLAGRAVARGWKPYPLLIFYMMLMGLFVRFLHYGLFIGATFPSWRDAAGDLFSLQYYITDTLVLIAMASLGFRLERVRQMTTQYRWLYRRKGLLSWESIT